MRWDPLSTWPKESRWIWLTIAGWVLVLRGPAFFDTLQLANPPRTLPDFFQEYAAARNWLDGRRIYEDHHDAAPRVVGVSLDDRRALVFVNAHPPTSVVVAIPFAKLAFADAFLTWNLVSLGARRGKPVDRPAPTANPDLAVVRRPGCCARHALLPALGAVPLGAAQADSHAAGYRNLGRGAVRAALARWDTPRRGCGDQAVSSLPSGVLRAPRSVARCERWDPDRRRAHRA